ncbi:MAG TPA: hypothetical protein GXX72_06555, partial [Clostridiaceae bacterium]|nr:hypothetical protein [Clostridiaceae bacterium]
DTLRIVTDAVKTACRLGFAYDAAVVDDDFVVEVHFFIPPVLSFFQAVALLCRISLDIHTRCSPRRILSLAYVTFQTA